ncbi:hypothetical protein [Haladaptatus halobius]|uniref:hypothetical protein n=1 Tax=Haladaptatus halobius TaxID=2884875 RepID=UPI001D0AA27F|nr:hypothetical protein [Haladaptatus halobius]
MFGQMSSWLKQRRLDVDAAIIGFIIALCLFPLRFFASQVYIKTIPIVLGLACALYLLAVRNDRETMEIFPSFSRPVAQLLPSVVFLTTAVMVAVALYSGERSVLFHLLTAIAGTFITLQILFTDDDDFLPSLLLAQILVLAVIVRFMAVYTTPSYVGIDIWTHITQLAQGVFNQHSLSAMQGDKHIAAPLYHLLVASSAMLYDVSIRNALYLSVGVAMPAAILFVYGATKLLAPARWAVFAAMLYSIGDYFIEWGIHLIPTSHGLVFFLAIIYALLRIMQLEYNARDFSLLVLLSIAIILTHQVSTFIMLVVLFSGLLAQFVLKLGFFQVTARRPGAYRKMEPVNLAGLLAFDMGLITFMWSFTPYNGDSFLETVLSYLAQTMKESFGILNLASKNPESIPLPKPTFIATVAEYIDTMGFLILFGLTVVGCLYVLRRKRISHSVFTLLFATVVMTVFTLGLPMFGIRNFIPQRWFAFLYAPMAILAALGVGYLVHNLDRRIIVATLLVVACLYPSVMVMSSHGAIDSPVFPSEQERLSYTEPEMAAVHTIANMTGSPDSANIYPNQVARTDHPYQTVFARTGSYPADAANISVKNRKAPAKHPITIYRKYQSTGAPQFRLVNKSANASVPVRRTVSRKQMCRPGQSILYTNGDVTMCANRSV